MLLKLIKSLASGWESNVPKPSAPSDRLIHNPEYQARQGFSNGLLEDFFRFVHQSANDNYDRYRFSYDGVDHSNEFNVWLHVNYLHEYFERTEEYFSVYRLLHDAASRELFRRLVLYRMLGHLHVPIKDGVTWKTEAAVLDKAREYDVGPSGLDIGGLFGRIRHHEGIPTPEGIPISLDCWNGNVAYTVLKKQYFYARDGVEIAPAPGDIILDAGACFGDTAVYFARTVGAKGHVYAFDPLPNHNRVIDFNIAQNRLGDRITPSCCAVGDSRFTPAPGESARFSEGSTALPGFSMLAGNPGFPVTTLDDFVETRALSQVDLIKMDIEGFELPALIGAQRVIERFRPKLAISLYHKPLDMIDIPLWLARHFPDYELHLDHYTIHQEETVLYGVGRRG